jgi:alcohol dehydrogenase class IV
VTDPATSQKKLIIDEAIVPPRALFDYAVTTSMSPEFTADGALDGLSHCLEVFYGAKGPALERAGAIAMLGIELVVSHVQAACRDGSDLAAREALGLGTDLGGYAIMVGGTNGAHLTSFSLVDVLSHGRACAIMNPYYTVFFAPAIEPQLRAVADIFRRGGYLRAGTDALHGRDLGLAVAGAMIELSRAIGFPTRLSEVPGFGEAHVRRALEAAKNPQLESKLQNMPVPMSARTVDAYMGPVLQAARTGDFSLIKNVS